MICPTVVPIFELDNLSAWTGSIFVWRIYPLVPCACAIWSLLWFFIQYKFYVGFGINELIRKEGIISSVNFYFYVGYIRFHTCCLNIFLSVVQNFPVDVGTDRDNGVPTEKLLTRQKNFRNLILSEFFCQYTDRNIIFLFFCRFQNFRFPVVWHSCN